MIYIVKEQGTNGPFKIGYTVFDDGVKSRVSSLQTGNPRKLEIVAVLKGGKKSEYAIHTILKQASAHVRGEWFNITNEFANFMYKAVEINAVYKAMEVERFGHDPDCVGCYKCTCEVSDIIQILDERYTEYDVYDPSDMGPAFKNTDLAKHWGLT